MSTTPIARVVGDAGRLEGVLEADGFEIVRHDDASPTVLLLGTDVEPDEAEGFVAEHDCPTFLVVEGYTPAALSRALSVGVDVVLQSGVSDREFLRILHKEMRAADESVRSPDAPIDVGLMVGSSEPMRDLCRTLARTAPAEAPVLITGESGTGKELVARSIHRLSPRRNGPFVAVNCGAIAESVIESELFGHVRGAFTGATEDRIGQFEAANGGTLFLDEIGELPLKMQVKLLRVLQDSKVQRVGESSPRQLDVRFVFATNRQLEEEVEEGRFRADLFYRINVLRIEVPALRRRKSDIEMLWEHFVQKAAEQEGRTALQTRPDVVRLLMRYDWPGNVRELENIARQAVIRRTSGKITPRIVRDRLGDVSREATPPVEPPFELKSLEEIERDAIIRTYEAVPSVKEACEVLGISERKMYYKLKQYREQGFLPEEGSQASRRPRLVFAHGTREAFDAVREELGRKFDTSWVPDGMQLLNAVYELGPDAVVAQGSLPVLDGLNILELGFQHGWDIPIVLLGVRDDQASRDYAEALGAAAVMDDPVDGAQLSWVIETALTVRTE